MARRASLVAALAPPYGHRTDAAAPDDVFASSWHDDPDWRGWWGDEPPFHTPVIVLTHRPRPPLEVGETTFHFLNAAPAMALAAARDLAHGGDVRIGGGPTVVRDFLAADLVHSLHAVLVPVVLGKGTSPWVGLDRLEERFAVSSQTTPSGVTRLVFTRSGPARVPWDAAG